MVGDFSRTLLGMSLVRISASPSPAFGTTDGASYCALVLRPIRRADSAVGNVFNLELIRERWNAVPRQPVTNGDVRTRPTPATKGLDNVPSPHTPPAGIGINKATQGRYDLGGHAIVLTKR